MSTTNFSTSKVDYAEAYRSFNGGIPSVTSSTNVKLSVVASRAGTVTSGYGKFSRNRSSSVSFLPYNPFVFHKEVFTGANGTLLERDVASASNVSEWGCFSNALGGAVTVNGVLEPTQDDIDSLKLQIDASLLNKLKQQTVNLALVFAERKRTADLIADTATKLAASLRSLKRGDIIGAARSLQTRVSKRKASKFRKVYRVNREKAIADGWLQLQYGWKPLLSDIYGSAELLAKQQFQELSGRVVSIVKKEWDTTEESDYLGRWTRLDRKNTRFDYSGRCRFVTSGAALASARNMGLTNPLSLAWELVPYSFVADWFIPVGPYLERLDATLGLSFQDGAYTRFTKGYCSMRLSSANRRASSRYYSEALWTVSITGQRQLIRCIREKMNTFPQNPPPGIKNPFSFTRATSAVALLIQLFKR